MEPTAPLPPTLPRPSAAQLGQLDALTIRSNAARQTYGYQTAATSYGAQSGLYQQEAQQAGPAGNLNAFSSLVGGASSVTSEYRQWQLAGAFGGGGGGGANALGGIY